MAREHTLMRRSRSCSSITRRSSRFSIFSLNESRSPRTSTYLSSESFSSYIHEFESNFYCTTQFS